MRKDYKYEQECLICGYKWRSRLEEPKACPRCKRLDWKRSKPLAIRRPRDEEKLKLFEKQIELIVEKYVVFKDDKIVGVRID